MIEQFIKDLDLNTDKVLTTVKDCSIDTLTAKKEDEWSILQILEHIYISDKAIYSMLYAPSERTSETAEIFGPGKLAHVVVDKRHMKVQSPDLLRPKGHFQNLEDFRSAFISQRESIKNDLHTEKIVIDNRIHNHFILGELTITDWLHFILFHTERHLKQIEDKFIS